MLDSSLERGIRARGVDAERTDSLSDIVDRDGEFRVLGFEQGMQRAEHWAGDVPVKIVRLQVGGVGVGPGVCESPAAIASRSCLAMPILMSMRISLSSISSRVSVTGCAVLSKPLYYDPNL